ncbi:MAG: iron ABC transporter substrate-binding protein [Desulfobacteraceae bacterium]|nr:iron ABC transporter substrate-binding protein [Desulfobacteraceae bacterium]
MNRSISIWLCMIFLIFTATAEAQTTKQITDAAGRTVVIPEKVNHIICSGPGCLRLVSYLGAQSLVVGVDDIEKRNNKFDARPYAFANPQFKKLPVFGGFRGRDIPEKIISLPTLPQVIFKTYAGSGYDPIKLSKKTGIPVITLEYGDLAHKRQDFYNALTILGQALNKQARSRELILFFDSQINQLETRTKNLPDARKKTCFVGGIAFKGPHGFQSTEPQYPPFQFINAKNIAKPADNAKMLRQSNFSKEKILTMDPQVVFLDLSTLQMGEDQGGLYELKNDPVYQGLTAVENKEVFGVLPYNWYTQNFGSILADAWFIGKILYPEQFSDIVPEKKADQIYTFLLSKPMFRKMDTSFNHMVFKRINLN